MKKLFALSRDQRGGAAIEMAIALPTLVLFIWGIFQLGIAFQASAGMQHALGEGARLATLCVDPTPATGCGAPTNAQIRTKISSSVFGTGVGNFSTPIVTDGVTATGTRFKDLSVTFGMPMNFLFFNGPSVSLTQTKRVYVAG